MRADHETRQSELLATNFIQTGAAKFFVNPRCVVADVQPVILPTEEERHRSDTIYCERQGLGRLDDNRIETIPFLDPIDNVFYSSDSRDSVGRLFQRYWLRSDEDSTLKRSASFLSPTLTSKVNLYQDDLQDDLTRRW